MINLTVVIDVILPGDENLNLPPASSINFSSYLKKNSKEFLAEDFISLLEVISKEKFLKSFHELCSEKKLVVINESKLKNIRLFTSFLTELMKAYYTSSEILKGLNVGSVPPFPNGTQLDIDDWTILEPVYERGIIYREVK